MAAVWGRAEIIVTADGSGLPAQTRAIADKAGTEGGESFAKAFDKSAGSGLKGAFAGFAKSMRAWNKNISDGDANIGRFRRSIQAFGKTLGNTTPMIRFRLGLGSLGDSFKNLIGSMEKAGGAVEKHQSLWSGLSHNTKQWTMIIGAVIAGMQDIAVLGSAAGSGLLVLGGAATAGIVGIIGLAAAFGPFVGDLKDLPPALRSSRKAFDQFTDAAKDLQKVLSVSVFEDSEDLWKSFGRTIKGLEGPVKVLGKNIRGVFDDLAAAIAPGERSFVNLQGLIEKSGPIFRDLMRIIGTFGQALLEAFNNPAFQQSVQELLGWLKGIADAFKTFTDDGQGQFTEWLDTGRRVFGALGGLLETTGQLLNDLVTPEATDRLVAFIDSISGFIAGPGADLIKFFGELDIFGLLAEALETFGKALEPLGDPMIKLADGINKVVDSGIDTLGPLIEDVATALAPLVDSIADFMLADPEGVANGFLLLAGGLLAIKGVGLAKVAADFLLFSTSIGTGGKNVKKFDVKKLGAIAAGVGLVGALAAGAATQEGELKMGFEALLGGALTGAMAGIIFGPVGIALGALIGAAFAANSSPEIQKFEDSVNTWLSEAMTNIGATFQSQMGVLGEGIANSWSVITAAFANGWQQIVDFFTISVPQFFADVGTKFQQGWTQITDFFGTVVGQFEIGWQQIVTFFTVSIPAFFASIATFFTSGWNNIIKIFTTFGAQIASAWNVAWSNLINIVVSVWSTIVSVVRGWFNNLVSIFTGMGATIAGIWNGIWSGLVGTVSSIWAGIVNTIRGAVNTVTGIINGLSSKINGVLGLISNLTGGLVNLKIPALPKLAAGAIAMGPRRVLLGEAGPEAVVPLNRPLSMVNPSVRGLSAIAQGKAPSGGTGGPTRILNVSPGAIQINGDRDPARTSLAVVNRLIERAV